MAFPDIPTVAGGRALTTVQANATSPRTFPNLSSLTKNAGDLLIAIIGVYQSSLATGIWSSWGASFTEFADFGQANNISLGAAYKWSTGSESGTFTAAQAGTITGHAAMILLSIPNANQTTAPTCQGLSFGTTASADSPSYQPSFGQGDTLWITVGIAGETGTAGAFTGLGTSPTNYSGDILTSISGDVVGGVQLGVSFRQLNALQEDVGTWSVDTSNARNASSVIAVPAVPPITVDTIMTGYARGVNPRAY